MRLTLLLFSLLLATNLCCPTFASDKPRVIVLTDITNEPDDEQSMVRYLCYANEFDTEALIATTSCWLRDKTAPGEITKRIKAYGEVRPNLVKHADGWPTADSLLGKVHMGVAEFGMEGVGKGFDSQGSKRIIEIVDAPDRRPVHVSIWGGANCLAQSLWSVKETRSDAEVKAFVSKLRVYSISDQDDAGPWMRMTFPELFYIVSPGYGHDGGSAYRYSTWKGISGDKFNGEFEGPDFSIVDNPWLDEHVRSHGPLGALHPTTKYLLEGDTPSFFWLIPNGLNNPQRPDYGGWGGRYEFYAPNKKPWHPPKPKAVSSNKTSTLPIAANGITADRIITEYQERCDYPEIWTDAYDAVIGVDGETYRSNQATIWRWRESYQHDFAARMDWSITPEFGDANHPPRIQLNANGWTPNTRTRELEFTVVSGDVVELDASATSDPDDDGLDFHWFQYREAGTYRGNVALERPTPRTLKFVAPSVMCPKTIHLILDVKDDGAPALHAFQRVVIKVNPKSHGKPRLDQRPRVFVTTDISDGEGDPDDLQSLCHLMYYADEFNIRAIVPDRFRQTARAAFAIALSKYERDYNSPWTKFRQYDYPTPSEMERLVKTKFDVAMRTFVAEAEKDDAGPLYVLAWGNLNFLAAALKNRPDLVKNIRLISIATDPLAPSDKGDGEKKNWISPERNEIFENYPQLRTTNPNQTIPMQDANLPTLQQSIRHFQDRHVGRLAWLLIHLEQCD
jgi:hypothetical protein